MNIKNIPMFENVNIADFTFKIKEYSKNETVYNQNDVCNGMDIVLFFSLKKAV